MSPNGVLIFGLPLPVAGLLLGLHQYPPSAAVLAAWCLLWAMACALGLLGALIRLGET